MARFGGHTVHEFQAEEEESEDLDASNAVASKLHAHQRGMLPATRTRKISYVQQAGGGGGGGGGGPGRIADLVILNQYDEDGNLAHKGTCIVKGIKQKIKTLNPELNPMTKHKDGSGVKVEMGYQIIDDEPKKPQRPWSAPRSKTVLERDSGDVPQPSEFPNKPMAVNAPPTRTRSEATSWLETHKDGSRPNLNRTLHAYSTHSINVPSATINSVKTFPDVNTTIVDVESASKAHGIFRERDSFKERENIPMSRRRRLARQPPARQRVRHNPSIGAAERAVPRVDKTSPPASPRAQKAKTHAHVRFEATDVMRPSSVISHVSSIHASDPDELEGATRRLTYSPPPHALESDEGRVDNGVRRSAPAGRVPLLATDALTAATPVERDELDAAAPLARSAAPTQTEVGGGKRAGGAGSGTGLGLSVDGVSRVRSAPQFAGASSSTGAGSSARGVQSMSARSSEAQRNSAMLRHVNAAHSDKRITDKTWSSALKDLEDKTKTQLQLLDRVVYVKRGYDDLASGPTYERPTVAASLKFRNAGMCGTPAAG
jgi:hypothetical protein